MVSESDSNDWSKWASYLFEDGDGTGRAIGDAWASWAKGIGSATSSNSVSDEWWRAAQTTGRHATDLVHFIRTWLNQESDDVSEDNVDDLRERIERLEALMEEYVAKKGPEA